MPSSLRMRNDALISLMPIAMHFEFEASDVWHFFITELLSQRRVEEDVPDTSRLNCSTEFNDNK